MINFNIITSGFIIAVVKFVLKLSCKCGYRTFQFYCSWYQFRWGNIQIWRHNMVFEYFFNWSSDHLFNYYPFLYRQCLFRLFSLQSSHPLEMPSVQCVSHSPDLFSCWQSEEVKTYHLHLSREPKQIQYWSFLSC